MNASRRFREFSYAVLLVSSAAAAIVVEAQESDKKDSKQSSDKPVAGMAETLKDIPKQFATIQSLDAAKSRISLQMEGEPDAKTWPLNADAELKRYGWWGRLEDFQPGMRVWVWMDLDRNMKPKSVLMLADEMSEQVIHDGPSVFEETNLNQKTVKVRPAVGEARELKWAAHLEAARDGDQVVFSTKMPGNGQRETLRIGTGGKIHVQTHGDVLVDIADAEGVERRRNAQKAKLSQRWRDNGLPGVVSVLHPLGGEMELLLDHEAMRWGRYLKMGDEITIRVDPPIKAKVKHVRPWRERTQLRLVTRGLDQADLVLGERVQVQVPEPPAEVQNSPLPTDVDYTRSKDERIEWVLCTIYCSCKIGGDRCTGMFYSQASCNVNACGMPNLIRHRVMAFIEKGMTDRQILEELERTNGAGVLQPHLLR